MADQATASRFDEKPSISNHYSWMRTWMGIQHTQMSAVRTATALIGFGFTVAQFFQKLQDKIPEGIRLSSESMPRNVARDL